MINVEQTIISQYANSPTLVQLIKNMNGYIDPQSDFDNFYSFVWNIQTAQAWGLDILGRIVNVPRQLQIPAVVTSFGFKEGVGCQPFGQAPFYAGPPGSNTYLLTDDAYRTLILMKALLNISNSSAPSINQLLNNLFAGRGRCYVADTGQMQLRFVFEFNLAPFEIAILTQSNAVPRPAAVQAQVMQIDIAHTFGFSEGGLQPFGQGTFFNPTIGLINAN
ncbi:MAG: hypothetical protein JWP38_3753 [Herbaspirillum sp.]|nr:hypothetical protein [Herbaspirillum sp.]